MCDICVAKENAIIL